MKDIFWQDDPPEYFGQYGGMFIPEILRSNFEELIKYFKTIKENEKFWQDYLDLLENYSGRPTPLTYAENLSDHFKGAKIYIKREDLNHSGAHKMNNVLGQGLIAKNMKKKRVIAETGAGQHGIATAIMAARMGLSCTIYMGAKDVERQRPNVFWMRNLGAEVVPVESGSQTLKDAINEAFRDWVSQPDQTHYVFGTACGPYPFPEMVTLFQSVIGKEARLQCLDQCGKLPETIYACVGGGSNALGIFSGFFKDEKVKFIGVEAGGRGIDGHEHASRIASGQGKMGVAQGYKTLFLQNEAGQMQDTHSIAAGLDYIGISPILADLHEKGRVDFKAATDEEVIEAFRLLMAKEGIIPALESTHAFVQAFKDAPAMDSDQNIIINLSGRGDKDIFTIGDALADESWKSFIIEKGDAYRA